MENQQRFNFKLRITLEHNFVYKLNLSPPYGRFNNEKKFILRSENSYIYYMYRLMVLSKVKTSSTNKNSCLFHREKHRIRKERERQEREMQERRREELRQRWEREEIEKQKQKLVCYSLVIEENIISNI